MTKLKTGPASFLPALVAVLHALPSMAEEAHEAKAGLPQLDTSLFPEQLFWLAVSFITLYVLMAFVALPGVRKTQDKRQASLAKELSGAAAANEQAKILMTQSEKALADARAHAQATVSEIKTVAAKESAQKQATQHKDLTQRLNDADKKMHIVRNMAIADAHKSAGELFAAIVEKLIGARA